MSSLRDRRQRQDSYFRRAKREGFAARSIYKLEQLDRRFHLLRPGQLVLDLGCRPGSWLQYASRAVGEAGHVVGLDREPPDPPIAANVSVVVGDALQIDPRSLSSALPEGKRAPFDVVLSDLAPDTSGIAFTDQVRSVELFLRALALSIDLGRPGGSFVGKVFMGEGFVEALGQVRRAYARSRTARPDATRRASSELYIVATGRRPASRSTEE